MKKFIIPLLCLATPVLASIDNREARSLAMGNTGVASASPGSAPLYNPALLSLTGETRKSQFIFAPLSMHLAVDADAREGYENISDDDYLDNMTDAMDGINMAVASSNEPLYDEYAAVFSSNADQLSREMEVISSEPLNLGFDLLLAFATTNQTLGFGLYTNGSAQAEVTPFISQCDRNLLSAYADLVTGLNPDDYATSNASYTCDGQTVALITGGELNDPADQLTSSLFVGTVMTTEVGLAFSHAFDISGTVLAVGITPKIINLTSQVAVPTLQQIDDDENYDLKDDLETSETDTDSFNLDVGIATRFLDDSLSVGFTAKNLIGESYKTAADTNGRRHAFELEPQAAVGVAYSKGGFTVASDLDLTANKAFFNDSKTQYLGIGMEYSPFSMLGFRAGARANLAESDPLLLTAGIHLLFFTLSAEFNADQRAIMLQFP